MTPSKKKAISARLENTERRIEKISRRKSFRRSTQLVEVVGYDKDLGYFRGKAPDGSIRVYSVESTASPRIGSQMEVAIANGVAYGKGDLKPLL